jgi:hypothetical protein
MTGVYSKLLSMCEYRCDISYTQGLIDHAKEIGVSENALCFSIENRFLRNSRSIDDYAKEVDKNCDLYGRFMGDEEITVWDEFKRILKIR